MYSVFEVTTAGKLAVHTSPEPKAEPLVPRQGVKCPGRDCPVHIHLFCYERLLSANRHQCKNCKTSWRTSEPTPIGEDAVPRREDDYATSRRGKKSKSGAVDSGRNGEDDELESEGGYEGGAQNQSQHVDLETEEEAEETVRSQRPRRH